MKQRPRRRLVRVITSALLSAVLVFPVAVLNPASASVTHSISGVVVDSSDLSKSVASSRVDLFRQDTYISTVTPSTGTVDGVSYSSFFRFTGLQPGSYTLRANFTGVRDGSVPAYHSGAEIAVEIVESATSTDQITTLSLTPYTRGPNSLTVTPILGQGEEDAGFAARAFYYELYCTGVRNESEAYTASVQGSQAITFTNLPSSSCQLSGQIESGTGLSRYLSTNTQIVLGSTTASSMNLEFYRHSSRVLSGVVKGNATSPAEIIGPGSIYAHWTGVKSNGQTHSWYGDAEIAADGSFSLTGVPNGAVSIDVNIEPVVSPYAQSHNFKLQVTDSTTNLNLILSSLPSGTSTLNILVNSTSGSAIAGASVNIQYFDQLNSRWVNYGVTTTDSEGKISKTSMPAGYFYFYVSKAGFEFRGSGKTVTAGVANSITLALFAKGDLVVSGMVKDSKTGRPVPGAVVQLEYGTGDLRWSKSVRVDSLGRYLVSGVINETITVKATGGSAKGYLSDFSAGKTLVMGGTNKTLDLELEPYLTGLSTITGIVSVYEPASTKANKLEPAAGVALRLDCSNEDGQNQYYDTVTTSNGAYSFLGLGSKSCTLEVEAGSYLSFRSSQSVSVSGLNSATRDIVLQRQGTGTLSGKVLIANLDPAVPGEPDANRRVYLSYQNNGASFWAETQSDASGNYSFQNVPTSDMGGRLSVRVEGLYESEFVGPEDLRTLPTRGTPLVHNFILKRVVDLPPMQGASSEIRGIVRDSSSPAQALAGVEVRLYFYLRYAEEDGAIKEYSINRKQTTGSDGSYSFTGLPKNQGYSMSARTAWDGNAPLYESKHRWFSLSATDSEKVVDFNLRKIPTGTGSISGTVVDNFDSPIPNTGVSVNLSGFESFYRNATSQANGSFELSNLPKGTFTLSAYSWEQANGRPVFMPSWRQTRSVSLATDSSAATGQNIVLERYRTGTATISGQLWDETLNAPVSGAQGWLFPTSDFDVPGLNFVTDSSGRWSLENVPDSVYSMQYYVEGENRYQPTQRIIDLKTSTLSGSPPTLALPRDASNTISGGAGIVDVVVYDMKTYKPVAGTEVSLNLRNSSRNWTLTTDQNGKVRFPSVVAGDYTFYASKDGFEQGRELTSLSIGAGVNTLRIPMQNHFGVGTIKGRVVDLVGTPVSNARVSIEFGGVNLGNAGEGGYYKSLQTDSRGIYELTNVPVGRELLFTVTPEEPEAPQPYLSTYSERFTVGAIPRSGDATPVTRTIDVVLDEAASITGRILNQSGDPISEISVTAFDQVSGQWLGWGYTDSDGLYTIQGVNPLDKVTIFVNDWSWRRVGGNYTFGFLAQNGASVGALSSGAGEFTTQSGQTLNVGNLTLSRGNVISGVVKINVGDSLVSEFQRGILIGVWVKDGNSWTDLSNYYNSYTSGWEAGRFTVGGLPDGEYKLEFSEPWAEVGALETVFVGPNGQKSTLAAATAFDLDSSKSSSVSVSSTNVSVSMAVAKPTSRPAAPEQALDNKLKDLVASEDQVLAGSTVELEVGKEHVGAWVAVSVKKEGRVSSAGVLSAMSVIAIDDEASTSTTDWVQVGLDGKIRLTGLSSLGSVTLAIQDAEGQTMGWTQIQVVSSLGSGVMIAPLASPRLLVAPTIMGNFIPGAKLTVIPGSWQSSSPVSYKYQWFRCATQVNAGPTPKRSSDCKEISGQTSQSYSVDSIDADKYITVRVVAKNQVGETVYFARSLSLQGKKAIQRIANPKMSGEKRVGKVLTISRGTWKAEARVAVSIRWMRCDIPVMATDSRTLASCVNIRKATRTSYKLRPADSGKYIVARVRAKSGEETSFFTPRSLRAIR